MKLDVQRIAAIERALVSTLALSQDYGIDAPRMGPDDFMHPLHRRLVKALNEEIDNEGSIGLALMRIEEKIAGTSHERDYVMAIGSVPLEATIARQYYAELKRQKIMREVDFER